MPQPEPEALLNAYEVLTNIQGFDSFHLSPASTPEDIARAYQTQSLIWHPDKNPGDAAALRTYKQLQRAYNMLMDPASRAAHDARLPGLPAQPMASHVACMQPAAAMRAPSVSQPPPEDLGLPPSSARPFAYVDKPPQPRTPAANAGMLRGDAIIRIGDAAHLRDVQGQLQANLHQPVPALVIEQGGRFVKKWVIPASWDPWAPASLLGCQMSDQCPIDLQSTHPAELLEKQRQRAAANLAAADEYPESHDEDRSLSIGVLPPRAPCWARLLLALTSIAGIALGGVIVAYPAFSYHIVDIWTLISIDCSSVGAGLDSARGQIPASPSETPDGDGAGGDAYLLRDGARGILAASCVIVAISFLGFCLSCCPASHTRGLLVSVYLCCGLPSWVLLIFVSVVAFALRDQADTIVVSYWDCLKAVSPDSAAEVAGDQEAYHHVEVAAGLCITSAVSLSIGMACACRVIGFHAIARHAIICISLGTGLLGSALLAVGLVLLLTTQFAKNYFDYGLMAIGGAVFLASLLGVVASKRESPCLLRAYSGSLVLVLLALLGCTSVLLALGPSGVEAWMNDHWNEVVMEHLIEMSQTEFQQLLSKNLLVLVTVLVLVVLVLAFDLLMVWVLQCSVSRYGRLYQTGMLNPASNGEAEPLNRQRRGRKETELYGVSR